MNPQRVCHDFSDHTAIVEIFTRVLVDETEVSALPPPVAWRTAVQINRAVRGGKLHAARLRLQQPGEDSEQRRFARPARPAKRKTSTDSYADARHTQPDGPA